MLLIEKGVYYGMIDGELAPVGHKRPDGRIELYSTEDYESEGCDEVSPMEGYEPNYADEDRLSELKKYLCSVQERELKEHFCSMKKKELEKYFDSCSITDEDVEECLEILYIIEKDKVERDLKTAPVSLEIKEAESVKVNLDTNKVNLPLYAS